MHSCLQMHKQYARSLYRSLGANGPARLVSLMRDTLTAFVSANVIAAKEPTRGLKDAGGFPFFPTDQIRNEK